jgi:hypothetical protein
MATLDYSKIFDKLPESQHEVLQQILKMTPEQILALPATTRFQVYAVKRQFAVSTNSKATEETKEVKIRYYTIQLPDSTTKRYVVDDKPIVTCRSTRYVLLDTVLNQMIQKGMIKKFGIELITPSDVLLFESFESLLVLIAKLNTGLE